METSIPCMNLSQLMAVTCWLSCMINSTVNINYIYRSILSILCMVLFEWSVLQYNMFKTV